MNSTVQAKVHSDSEVRSREHRQNMEAMAAEVAESLHTVTFGTRSLMCERGIKQDLLDLSEQNKIEHQGVQS